MTTPTPVFKVEYRSRPGMIEQYRGVMEIPAATWADAVEQAHNHLNQTFPERNRGMWRLEIAGCAYKGDLAR